MSAGKGFVIGAWVILIAAFFAPASSSFASLGQIGFFAMAGAHVLEFLVFLPRLRAAGGSLGGHFVQTLIFGMFHISALPEAAAGE